MPFNFDASSYLDEEIGPTPGMTSTGDFWEPGAEEAQESIEESSSQSVAAPQMSDMDNRINLIQAYRSICQHDFFDGATPQTQQVQNEIRAFVNDRLEILLGYRTERKAVEQPVQVFSKEEIAALKLVAEKIMTKPQLASAPPPRPPTVRRAPQQPTESVAVKKSEPVQAPLKKAQAPIKPNVRKASAPPPEPVQQKPATPPTKTLPKPVQRAVATKPAPKATEEQSDSSEDHGASLDERIPDQFRKDPTVEVVNDRVYVAARNSSGETIEDRNGGGIYYRWVGIANTPTSKFEPPVTKHQKSKLFIRHVLSDGNVIFRDSTPVSYPRPGTATPIPTPSPGQVEMIATQHANSMMENEDRKFRQAGVSIGNIVSGLVR